MNEFDLINKYLSNKKYYKDVILGIGDDAAIIKSKNFDMNISTDMLIENQHFFPDVSAKNLAYKVLAVNLSDMAAMGANPRFVLLSMGLPHLEEKWLDDFFEAIFKLSKLYKFNLVGGDVTKSEKKVFNITIIGYTPVNHSIRRSNAKVGDDIWVSGQLGLAAASLDHHWKKVILDSEVFAKCELQRLRPIPRVNLGKKLINVANSAIDVSDGFAKDLGHILDMSKVGANVYIDTLPTLDDLKKYTNKFYNWVVCGGDDYELIFTSSPINKGKILSLERELDIKLTKVGIINSSLEYNFLDKNNNKILFNKQGFDHFE